MDAGPEFERTLVNGFGIGRYRSFHQIEYLAPLGTVTLVAGQNNCGKSNVLRFARDFLRKEPRVPDDLDRPLIADPRDWQITLAIPRPRPSDEDLPGSRPRERHVLDRIFEQCPPASDSRLWYPYRITISRRGENARASWELKIPVPTEFYGRLSPDDKQHLRRAAQRLTGRQITGPLSGEHEANMVFQNLAPDMNFPPVRVIEAFRQIRKANESDASSVGELGTFDGVGLVERLEQLERPSRERQADEAKFHEITAFVRSVLDDETATLRIPHDAETILVRRGKDDFLPLASLGTGVHQVVILAAAATLLDSHLVCIEEPEVHLHPVLQRRLIKFLAERTTNQYLIATHSAHLLDYERSGIFHLTINESGTHIDAAATPHQLSGLCSDLGYRPSDLLQSNAVLWVEGPSDRIYLRHWIGLLAPDLTESIHYSIMTYGGRLLSHLSPDDPPATIDQRSSIDDFISLRRLNRWLVVVIDSDKKASRQPLQPTKKRVKDAFDASDGPGFAWITNCYTIENYVPVDLLEAAVGAVHPRSNFEVNNGQWTPPINGEGRWGFDKVAVAREVCKVWSVEDLDKYDLRRRMRAVIDLIDTANGRPPRSQLSNRRATAAAHAQ